MCSLSWFTTYLTGHSFPSPFSASSSHWSFIVRVSQPWVSGLFSSLIAFTTLISSKLWLQTSYIYIYILMTFCILRSSLSFRTILLSYLLISSWVSKIHCKILCYSNWNFCSMYPTPLQTLRIPWLHFLIPHIQFIRKFSWLDFQNIFRICTPRQPL